MTRAPPTATNRLTAAMPTPIATFKAVTGRPPAACQPVRLAGSWLKRLRRQASQ